MNIGTARKTGQKLCAIMAEILKTHLVIGSDGISVHTAASARKASAERLDDMITTFAGLVRCAVHPPVLCIKDVFPGTTFWQKYMKFVNNATSYFNQHPRGSQRLVTIQLESGTKKIELIALSARL